MLKAPKIIKWHWIHPLLIRTLLYKLYQKWRHVFGNDIRAWRGFVIKIHSKIHGLAIEWIHSAWIASTWDSSLIEGSSVVRKYSTHLSSSFSSYAFQDACGLSYKSSIRECFRVLSSRARHLTVSLTLEDEVLFFFMLTSVSLFYFLLPLSCLGDLGPHLNVCSSFGGQLQHKRAIFDTSLLLNQPFSKTVTAGFFLFVCVTMCARGVNRSSRPCGSWVTPGAFVYF